MVVESGRLSRFLWFLGFSGFLMPGAPPWLRWNCASVPLQRTDWACCVQLHSASKPLPLLLLTSQPLTRPLYIATDWTGGAWPVIWRAAALLLFLRSCYSTTGPTHSLRRSFTVIQLEPARYSSPNHNCRLALCFKQGFW